ncbi:MAG: FliM/FliN family flagellar motor switch protein [Planctomycetota bacterium]
MAKDCPRYDFKKPGRIDEPVARYLRAWLLRACTSFQQRWTEICNSTIKVTPEPLYAQAFSNFQESCDPASFGTAMRLDSLALNSQVVVSQVDLLSLVLELLAEELEAKPAWRELTSIESNLSELLMENFCSSLGESWLQLEPLNHTLGPLDPNPQRGRMFGGGEPVIVAGILVQAKAGAMRFQWILPRANLTTQLNQLLGESGKSAEKKPVDLRAAISEMPLDVVVRLGEAKIPMDELLALRPGAVVVFDQSIGTPLTALLDNQPLFSVWPGRQGTKQSFQVAEIIQKR